MSEMSVSMVFGTGGLGGRGGFKVEGRLGWAEEGEGARADGEGGAEGLSGERGAEGLSGDGEGMSNANVTTSSSTPP